MAMEAAEGVVVEGGVAPELPVSVRIYVGGLGAGVTSADIEKTFSSLGHVSLLEFVQRSDSLRFAFMDFKPHSEKSIPKLFSTYNGCIWKGGKLKLEKAKEHYMDRLKREWAEDAQVMSRDYLNSEDTPDKSPEELKPKPEEKSHIRIFFPKLTKVKALPFKGTGRHKYSFQRVEVPPLPVNFCDCEEHCRPCKVVTKEQPPSNTGPDIVVGLEELHVMNSVMEKLFSREADKNVVVVELSKPPSFHNGISSDAVNEEENVIGSKTEVTEAEVSGEEEDFVVNFGVKKSENVMDLLQAKEWGKKPRGQDGQKESSIQQLQEKKSRTRQQMEDDNTATELLPDRKKFKSASDGHRKWFPDFTSCMKGDPETAAEQLEGSSEQLQSFIELESKENPAANNNNNNNKSGKGSTWLQKSSWRDLVGDTSSSLFSLSHVLPSDRVAAKPKLQKTCDEAVARSTKKAPKPNNCSDTGFFIATAHKVSSQRITSESGGQEAPGEACTIVIAEAGISNETKENDAESSKEGTNPEGAKTSSSENGEEARSTVVPCNQEPKISPPPVRIGEVCTFMRNAESQKQWTKAKTALNSYFKKRSTAESSSKRRRDGLSLRS